MARAVILLLALGMFPDYLPWYSDARLVCFRDRQEVMLIDRSVWVGGYFRQYIFVFMATGAHDVEIITSSVFAK